MRTDLGMRKGKMIAQGAHASIGAASITEVFIGDRDDWKTWNAFGTTKICVRVGSEQELMVIYAEAMKAKLPVYLVTDSGKTEFHGEATRTCLAIGPAKSDLIDKITGDLKLL